MLVIATPAPATAALLRPHDDEVAGLLDAIDYASVVLVTFRVDADDIPATLHGTGFLVPRRSPHKGREPWAVTACASLDRKWAAPRPRRRGAVSARCARADRRHPAPPGGATRRSPSGPGRSPAPAHGRGEPGAGSHAGHTFRERLPASTGSTTCCARPGWSRALAGLGGVAITGAAYRGVGIPGLHRQRAVCGARALVSGRLPRRGRIAAPWVAAGVLLALSLPPWGWWPLGFVGAALLYWRLAGLRLRSRLWSGWLAGLGCYAIGLFWARAFNWSGAGSVSHHDRGALLRRGRRRHATTGSRARPGLRRCVHPWPSVSV